MASIFLLALVAAVSLFPLLSGYIIRFVLRTAGDHLRRKTSAKRELITQRVRVDEEELSSGSQSPGRKEDEDWERVESYAVGTAANGAVPQEKDFAGVIGFFHPFW
jgi:hypothetical protein